MASLPTIEDLLHSYMPFQPGTTPGSAMAPSAPMAPTPMQPPPSYSYSPEARPIAPPYQGSMGVGAGAGYAPVADALASWGVQQDGPWQNLAAWAAPAVDQGERFLRGVRGVAAEATGLPAAGRAGEAFAAGNYGQAAGQALQALPSRLTQLPGMLISDAGAQAPDARLKRISDLQAEVKAREKTLRAFSNRQFPSARARADAVKLEEDGITAARSSAKALQDAMDAEASQAAAAERARLAGAAWARTPFQARYPGALEGGVAATAAAGGLVPFFATRGRVRHHVSQVQGLDDQITAAVARANNNALAPKTRTQAANDARALQAQREQLVGQGTGDHGMWGHLGAAAGGGALTELPMAGALAHDYLAGRADPSGELYDKTLESVNLIDHPGQVLGRYAIPFGLGAAAGGAGHYLGSQGGNVPAGHAGAVGALKRQYRAPRKR